ncbi:glycosyltransferase family 2 protein [Polynucleobacter paneuropaeus]|nr:glycosyltransferase family 2 protein [Polynucleobacter paneuropaeus]
MKLSLIIPCYNEAASLPLLLEHTASLGSAGNIEVILVDNGSTDNSFAILKELLPNYPHCRSIRVPINRGYGFGILSGLRAATGDLLSWTHADMQTDPADVLRGLELFQLYGNNIYVKGRRIKRSLLDRAFTMAMSVFETLLLGSRLWDINAQPNMFPRNFFESWVNPPCDFSLDLYVYFSARKQKLSIHRFPVEFKGRIHGVSHWNVNWSSKLKFIRRTIKFSFELKKREK